MNQAVTSISWAATGRHGARPAWSTHEEAARLRRLRSLIALFALYVSALLIVITISEGADIGCVLGGIAGHVLFATLRVARRWRDAASLEDAKRRLASPLRPRFV